MKRNRIILMLASIIAMAAFWGFIALEGGTELFQGLDLFILILIVVIAAIAFILAIKKGKKEKEGLTIEDELSLKIKYKSGYYAYLYSMYMWLFIFIFKDKFPNIESMLGGGVLLSAIIYGITKFIISKDYNEKN